MDEIRRTLRVCNLKEVSDIVDIEYMRLWRAIKKGYDLTDQEWQRIDQFINNITQKAI